MNPISNFFDRFKKLLANSSNQKQGIITALKTVANIDISPEKIQVKGVVGYITASPIIKNEIFLKKEKILNEIEKITSLQSIKDIK